MPRPKVGEVFQNRYLILSELGAGGMGLVFRAKQVDAEREVAIKAIRSEEVRDQEAIARFYREFQLLAKLIHPNIVTIYGLELDDHKFPFAICELIEGDNLRNLLNKNGPFSWERAVKIVLQIAQAMQFAHENGVIHRDLKPDNVMLLCVPEPDFVKLVDFGLSRVAQSEGEDSQMLTATGQLIGSANYMSPEQIKQRADERSDIYSLGCVLFELLSGEYLFDADTPIGTVYKHLNEDVGSRFAAINVKIPKRLFAIMSRLLDKDPLQRYQTMNDVAIEMQDLLDSPGPIVGSDAGTANAGKQILNKLSLKICIVASFCLLGTAIFLASRMVKPQKPGASVKTAAVVTLPIRGLSMQAMFEREKNVNQRVILAKLWLEKYSNGQTSSLDRLIVLEGLARSYYLLSNPADCVETLNRISKLLPAVEERDRASVAAKARAYQLLVETYTIVGKRSESVAAAKDCLLMLKRIQDRFGWLEVSDYAVTTMMICGEYKDALELYEQYQKNNSEAKGTAICSYYRSLGDLEILLGKMKQGHKFYDKASRSLPFVLDKITHINALTGLAIGGSEYSTKSTKLGLALIGLSERMWYLDKKSGTQLFYNGLKLIEEEQKYGGSAVKGGEVLSRAFDTVRLESQSWLILMQTAQEIDLADAAERCASMAVEAARNKRELVDALAALSIRLLESGNEMQTKQTFSRFSLSLNKLDLAEQRELGCKYTAALLELAVRNGFSNSADYYLSQAGEFMQRGVAASKAKPVDFAFVLSAAMSCQLTGKIANAKSYFQVIEKLPCKGSIKDVSEDAVLLGISADAAGQLSDLNRVLPDYALVKVVAAYLRNDWPDRAEKYLALKEHDSTDNLSIALAHFKLARYFLAHAKPELASAQFSKAYELYITAAKPYSFGRGLPLNLRCQFLINQCQSHEPKLHEPGRMPRPLPSSRFARPNRGEAVLKVE